MTSDKNPGQDFVNKWSKRQLINMYRIENFSNKVLIVKGSSSDHSLAYLSNNGLLHWYFTS